jgi:hypothetical protein
MKSLSKTSQKTFAILVKMAKENEGYIKVNNNKEFMPVSVEIIERNEQFTHVSIAHYFEQNGDLLADPEMCFAICNNDESVVYPYMFKMDTLGTERYSIHFNKEGGISGYNNQQYDDAVFANQWMRNIKKQQSL